MNDLLDEQWTLSKKCENRKHFNSHLYPIGILFVFKLHYQKYLYILSDFNLRVDQSKNEIQHTKITSNLKVWQFIHSFQEALSFCQYKPVAQLPQQLSWFQKLVTWVQIKQGAKTLCNHLAILCVTEPVTGVTGVTHNTALSVIFFPAKVAILPVASGNLASTKLASDILIYYTTQVFYPDILIWCMKNTSNCTEKSMLFNICWKMKFCSIYSVLCYDSIYCGFNMWMFKRTK